MKPILFKTEMVRAILSGQKTVTRRVIKGANPEWPFVDLDDDMSITAIDRHGEEYPKDVPGLWATFASDGYPEYPAFKAPYQAGDILYVRESWAPWSKTEGVMPRIHYKADDEELKGVKWKPSIHMPKKAARIFLKVTDVKVERLGEMTRDDYLREGIQKNPSAIEDYRRFRDIWNSTVRKGDEKLYGEKANPWVWVIKFERCEKIEETADG